MNTLFATAVGTHARSSDPRSAICLVPPTPTTPVLSGSSHDADGCDLP